MNRTRQSKFQENTLLTNQTNLTINVATGARRVTPSRRGVEFIYEEQYNPAYTAASLGTLVPGERVQPEPHRRAAGLRAGAQRRVHARRDADRRRLPVRHPELRREVGSDGRFPPRRTTRISTARRSRRPRAPDRCCTLVPARRGRHAVLVQGRRAVQAGAERQHLSVACQFASSPRAAPTSRWLLRHGRTTRTAPISSPPRARTSSSARSGNSAMARWPSPARIFDSSNKNELMPDATNPTVFVQVGEREVKGIELGIVGKLTDNWELSAGIAKMDTEVVQGSSDADRLADQLVARADVLELDHLPHCRSASPSAAARATWTPSRARSRTPCAAHDEHADRARVLGDRRHAGLPGQRQGDTSS